MNSKTQKYLVLGGALVMFILFIGALVLFAVKESNDSSDEDKITSFEECVAAGNPVMESYPEQCRTKDGKLFVNEAQMVDQEGAEVDESEQDEYYGSSTNATCATNTDCAPLGCNAEICGGASEEIASVCLFPESPLPTDLGYSCGCVNSQCQWSK